MKISRHQQVKVLNLNNSLKNSLTNAEREVLLLTLTSPVPRRKKRIPRKKQMQMPLTFPEQLIKELQTLLTSGATNNASLKFSV